MIAPGSLLAPKATTFLLRETIVQNIFVDGVHSAENRPFDFNRFVVHRSSCVLTCVTWSFFCWSHGPRLRVRWSSKYFVIKASGLKGPCGSFMPNQSTSS